MLPVVVGEKMTLQHIVLYSVVVTGVSFLLVPVVPMGPVYTVTAAVLGVLLIVGAERLRRNATHPMTYFGFTNLYLAGVFLAMAVDTLVG